MVYEKMLLCTATTLLPAKEGQIAVQDAISSPATGHLDAGERSLAISPDQTYPKVTNGILPPIGSKLTAWV